LWSRISSPVRSLRMLNTCMRYQEFKNPQLNAYQVIVVLSDYASAPTIIYADTPENAQMIAAKQFGSENIVSVNSPNTPYTPKPLDKASAIQFWSDRLRRFARPKKQKIPDDALTNRVRAQKAQRELNRLTQTKD
jgi:hypothetical protein